jgi:hypothetical protein
MPRAEKPGLKKSYAPPVLKVYGTVRELTKTVGLRRSTDGGRFPHNRTSTV